jgi:hydrogenase-4 transcriptional activator
MEARHHLLLDVWREVCRHIEIQEATRNLAERLAQHLPLSAVIVRQFISAPPGITTVAQSAVGRYHLPQQQLATLSPTLWKRAQSWGRQWHITVRPRGSSPRELKPMIPDGITDDLLLGPLTSGDTVTGVVLLVAAPNKHFEATHREIAESLLEPFSVALDNDHRLRELAELREAAEADRRSLLARLGRTDLSDTIVGADSGLKPIMERVALVARSDVPVLILGETGTGKEVISRAIHNHSSHASGPFIRVNCGAIPPELIDSQLFGHEKGSFTGASEMRKGWFERADGGTLFLDEVGELPLPAQVRLLRVLEDHELERVGG